MLASPKNASSYSILLSLKSMIRSSGGFDPYLTYVIRLSWQCNYFNLPHFFKIAVMSGK